VTAAPFRFDRSWRFDATADELWDSLADTGAYPAVFSWLRDYQAGPLEAGTVARFRVQPPLPYSLHLVVTVLDVVDRRLVRARVDGDVRGEADLAVASTGDGSTARLRWDLELIRPSLARVEPVARRPMIWGHDLVVAMGVRQFRRKVLS
jgi:hypothetical protein